jgi:hypothetical protein
MLNITYNFVTYTLSVMPYIGIGFFGNKLYSLYKEYKYEKNIQKIVVKQIYISLFDTLYKQFGENINDLDKIVKENSNNKLSLKDFDKLKKITYLLSEVAKEHNKKYKIIINNNKLSITLIDKTYIDNILLRELLEFADLKIIKNIDDEQENSLSLK